MRKIAVLLIPVAFLLTSCSTLPGGWEDTETANVGSIASKVIDLLNGSLPVDSRIKLCIATSGAAAGLNFFSTSGEEIKARLLEAVGVADKYAKENYRDLYDQYSGLDGIIAHALGQPPSTNGGDLSQAEYLLGLLNAITQGDFLKTVISTQ